MRTISKKGKRLCLLPRVSLRAVLVRLRSLRPAITVVSDVRTLCCTALASTPNSMSRIQRYASTLVRLTGQTGVSLFVINRIAGRNTVTNPGILRRLISAILCFRNSHFTDRHLLHSIGGHFNTARRLNMFRVISQKLTRVDGPSTLFLNGHSRRIPNVTAVITYRKAHPLIMRLRSLIDPADCDSPQHSAANVRFGQLLRVLTILRGQINVPLSGLSTCITSSNKLAITRPTTSLNITVSIITDFHSHLISPRLILVNRINLNNRIQPVSRLRLHLGRTIGLNFGGTVIPGNRGIGMSKLSVIRISQIISTVTRTLGK